MERTITELSTDRNELRLFLRPATLNIRNEFQNVINSRIIKNNSRLPSTPMLDGISVIDRETIIEINNSTTSEKRVELMRSIINSENIDDNSDFLLENSTNQVRTYLYDLLIRSAMHRNITEEDLYRVGNIFLYTIANLSEEGLFVRDIVQHLRENMVNYNTNQILTVLRNHIPIYNDYLETLRLATDRQLSERSEEFLQEVEGRVLLNRRRVLYAGLGLVGSMALIVVKKNKLITIVSVKV